MTNVDPGHPPGAWNFWEPSVGARKLYICSSVPASPRIGDRWDDTFSFRFDPEENAWVAVTEVPVTFPTNTYTRSIVNPAVDLNGVASTRVARMARTAGAEVNDRRFITFDDVPLLDDVRMKACLFNRASPQQGLAVRINNIGNTTLQNAYVVWNDDTQALAPWWNMGNWKGTDANFTHNEPTAGYVEALEVPFDIIQMKRTSGVVAALLEPGRDYRNANSIVIVGNTGLGNGSFSSSTNGTGNFAPHTMRDNTADGVCDICGLAAAQNAVKELVHATWTQAGADETATSFPTAGKGGSPGGYRVYPHWIELWLKGTTLRARWWRGRSGDTPPGWNDPRFAMVWRDTTPLGPTGTGKVGLVHAHQNIAGNFADWAWVEVTRGEPGRKVYTASGWKSLEHVT